MTYAYVTINSLSDLDYDDLYERSKDIVESNWPSISTVTAEEKKAIITGLIQSSIDGQWAGAGEVGADDRYLLFKIVNTDTDTAVGIVSGYITPDGTFDAKHSLSSPDGGSRNYIYTEQNRLARDQYYRDNGITKIKYNNLPEESPLYKFLKLRAGSGYYTIVSDEECSPGFRTVVTQPNI